MRQIASLLWKEWRETRVFLIIALGIFVGLPIIGEFEDLAHHRQLSPIITPWVMALGGVLAIFVAVGSSCRDLNGRVLDFWRSRPVGVVPWLLVKYVVGLLIVLISCIVPLVLEVRTRRPASVDVAAVPEMLLAWCPFLWIALYSIAFLCGCLIRRIAHAAMLGIAAMLLVYFLPLVLPPLESFNISWVLTDSASPRYLPDGHLAPAYHYIPWLPWPVAYEARQLLFVAGMLGMSAVVLIVSLLSVRRDWRIESGQKMMYGSIGSAVLILFASAAFQLGTNLRVVQTVAIPADEMVIGIQSDGTQGVLYTARRQTRGVVSASAPEDTVRRMTFDGAGVELGPPIRLGTRRWVGPWNLHSACWIPEHSNVVYAVHDDVSWSARTLHLQLKVADLATGRVVVKEGALPDSTNLNGSSPAIFGIGDRLFIVRDVQLAILDVSDPLDPKVVSVGTLRYGEERRENGDGSFALPLPLLPNLSARQRLSLRFVGMTPQIRGDFFYAASTSGIRVYRLDQLTDSSASFVQVGQYESTLLEQVFGSSDFEVEAGWGLVYLSERTNGLALGASRLTVFDVHDARHPYPAGHFAVPDDVPLVVCPLPDGRALVGGSKLYLLGPPAPVSR